MTTPQETVRCASLPDDYTEFIEGCQKIKSCECHKGENKDDFLRRCVNNGVPIRTSHAIDMAVFKVLTRAGVSPDVIGTEHGPQTFVETPYNSYLPNIKLDQLLQKNSQQNNNVQQYSNPNPNGINACSCKSEACLNMPKPFARSWVGLATKIRCIHVDTMANRTFLKSSMTPKLDNPIGSKARIQVANKHQVC